MGAAMYPDGRKKFPIGDDAHSELYAFKLTSFLFYSSFEESFLMVRIPLIDWVREFGQI